MTVMAEGVLSELCEPRITGRFLNNQWNSKPTLQYSEGQMQRMPRICLGGGGEGGTKNAHYMCQISGQSDERCQK